MKKPLTQAQLNRQLERKKVKEREEKLLASYYRRLEKQKVATKKWRAENPGKVAAQQARYYAKKAEKYAQLAAAIAQAEQARLTPEPEPVPTPNPVPTKDLDYYARMFQAAGVPIQGQNDPETVLNVVEEVDIDPHM